MPAINCRHFTGFKPCAKNELCSERCPFLDPPLSRVLIVHLEAMGAVLRATSLLPSIKRKFPKCHITWVTKAPSHRLLEGNSLIDRVLTSSSEDLLSLKCLNFDVAFCIDKSLQASGVLSSTQFDKLYGFSADACSGAILPATPAAHYLWKLGLSNHEKFFINQKSETQLMTEALELGEFKREPYVLMLSEAEKEQVTARNKLWAPDGKIILGINTGCAPTIAYKKLSIQRQKSLIKNIETHFGCRIVLLGGPDDTDRNNEIAKGTNTVTSPTGSGLRDGLVSVAACDIVISGDSLGMHMAIALKKWVVAWFGPTCSHEIDLYDRGVKVMAKVGCSPCWKRSCHKSPMCYEMVSEDEFLMAVKEGIQWVKKSSSSKQPSLEMRS